MVRIEPAINGLVSYGFGHTDCLVRPNIGFYGGSVREELAIGVPSGNRPWCSG